MVLTPLIPHQMRTDKEILEQIERDRIFIDNTSAQPDKDLALSFVSGGLAALEWVLRIPPY